MELLHDDNEDTSPSPAVSSGSASQNNDWTDALNRAENIAGYPTSFLGLKFLLKDEISNLAFQIRRLIAARHPVIITAKYAFNQSNAKAIRRKLN